MKKTDLLLPEESDSCKWAAIRADSIKNAAIAIKEIYKNGIPVNLGTMKNQLMKAKDKILAGEIAPLESMLIGQAQTLEALFYYAAERISHCETREQMSAYADIAIKATNACRKTIGTLHELKNPQRPIFIREQNNSLAQQVNNNLTLSKISNPENELLTEVQHETLDSRRAFAASSVDTEMEAVEVGRGKDRGRQAKKQNEWV